MANSFTKCYPLRRVNELPEGASLGDSLALAEVFFGRNSAKIGAEQCLKLMLFGHDIS
jgi:hypothetical protein